MKKSFQKTLIAASVGVILAAGSASSFAAAVGTTNMLFPYISTGTNAYSFISILTPSSFVATANKLHFAYAMKAVTAPNFNSTGTSACDHSDGLGSHTTNDLMQFEVRNRINMPTTFGDTTSVPYYYNGGVDKQGFLIVNAGSTGDSTRSNATIYGEAVVVDTASGLRLAYSSSNLNTDAAFDPDFTTNNVATAGGPEVAPSAVAGTPLVQAASVHMSSWYASNTVTTGWFVAPLGFRSEMTPSAGGGLVATYNMYQSDFAQTGAYNANEAFQSGAAPTKVQCLGIIQRSDILLPAGVVNTANGGWANLVTNNADVTGTGGTTAAVKNKSLVYKLQSTGALGAAVSTVSREANK